MLSSQLSTLSHLHFESIQPTARACFPAFIFLSLAVPLSPLFRSITTLTVP